MYFDLRTVCYRDFLDFIFDHPVAPQFSRVSRTRNADSRECWYDSIDLDIDFDPARNCEFLTLLFCDPRELLHRYSLPQLEQGFWWMQTSYNDGSAADILWTGSLPVGRRVAMIRAMYFLYADLFATVPLGRAPHMWWEGLTRVARYVGESGSQVDLEDIEDAKFETLTRLLELESESCRIDALHGLNHLTHPGKETAIREYLERHVWLDENHRRYAERAITGALL